MNPHTRSVLAVGLAILLAPAVRGGEPPHSPEVIVEALKRMAGEAGWRDAETVARAASLIREKEEAPLKEVFAILRKAYMEARTSGREEEATREAGALILFAFASQRAGKSIFHATVRSLFTRAYRDAVRRHAASDAERREALRSLFRCWEPFVDGLFQSLVNGLTWREIRGDTARIEESYRQLDWIAEGAQAAFNDSRWVRSTRALRKDKENLAAYIQGEISPLQKTMAEAFVALGKRMAGRGAAPESREAARRAWMFHPGSPEARALWDSLPPLPDNHKEWKSRPLQGEYLAAVEALRGKLADQALEMAEAFANRGLPQAAQYALEQMPPKARARKSNREREGAILETLGKGPLRLLSFNFLVINQDGPPNSEVHWPWKERWLLIEASIRESQADIIGVQENGGWREKIMRIFQDVYAWYGPKECGAKKGSWDCSIMVNRHRFDVLEKGVRFLNRYDDLSNTKKDWGADCRRDMGWLKLRDKWTGWEFFVFNTHLAWAGESYKADDGTTGSSEDLRVKQVEVCLDEIAKAHPLLPKFFTGDFNTGRGSPVFWKCMEGGFDPVPSVCGGIDWILASASVEKLIVRTGQKKTETAQASDHPVILGLYNLPRLADLEKAWQASPGDGECFERFLIALRDIRKIRKAIDSRRRTLKEDAEGAMADLDNLLWVEARMEAGFGDKKKAISLYAKLARQHRDTLRGQEAEYQAFSLKLTHDLARDADLHAMRRFIKNHPESLWAAKTERALNRALEKKVKAFEALLASGKAGRADLAAMARFALKSVHGEWAKKVRDLLARWKKKKKKGK
ncbi:MAG: exonuclease/endonuclease/phosphatase family protein [Planctomycetota bacterium]|jgi:endonuclease/exonuclease/phosphatase family metal-dependent hydrolase